MGAREGVLFHRTGADADDLRVSLHRIVEVFGVVDLRGEIDIGMGRAVAVAEGADLAGPRQER